MPHQKREPQSMQRVMLFGTLMLTLFTAFYLATDGSDKFAWVVLVAAIAAFVVLAIVYSRARRRDRRVNR